MLFKPQISYFVQKQHIKELFIFLQLLNSCFSVLFVLTCVCTLFTSQVTQNTQIRLVYEGQLGPSQELALRQLSLLVLQKQNLMFPKHIGNGHGENITLWLQLYLNTTSSSCRPCDHTPECQARLMFLSTIHPVIVMGTFTISRMDSF